MFRDSSSATPSKRTCTHRTRTLPTYVCYPIIIYDSCKTNFVVPSRPDGMCFEFSRDAYVKKNTVFKIYFYCWPVENRENGGSLSRNTISYFFSRFSFVAFRNAIESLGTRPGFEINDFEPSTSNVENHILFYSWSKCRSDINFILNSCVYTVQSTSRHVVSTVIQKQLERTVEWGLILKMWLSTCSAKRFLNSVNTFLCVV